MVLIKNIAMGEFFEGFYLIKSVELRRTRAGKDFLAIVFQDRTGTISGNIWDANPKAVKQFVAGRVVHMKALKELYNGMPQVNRISLRLPEGNEPANPADYREKSPVNETDLRKSEVYEMLGAVKTEFGKFETSLKKVHERLQQSEKEINTLITTRTNVMNRKLRTIDAVDKDTSAALLEIEGD
jgi:23S rRNA maturation-related 3'-5' exoribonuclease YhaM